MGHRVTDNVNRIGLPPSRRSLFFAASRRAPLQKQPDGTCIRHKCVIGATGADLVKVAVGVVELESAGSAVSAATSMPAAAPSSLRKDQGHTPMVEASDGSDPHSCMPQSEAVGGDASGSTGAVLSSGKGFWLPAMPITDSTPQQHLPWYQPQPIKQGGHVGEQPPSSTPSEPETQHKRVRFVASAGAVQTPKHAPQHQHREQRGTKKKKKRRSKKKARTTPHSRSPPNRSPHGAAGASVTLPGVIIPITPHEEGLDVPRLDNVARTPSPLSASERYCWSVSSSSSGSDSDTSLNGDDGIGATDGAPPTHQDARDSDTSNPHAEAASSLVVNGSVDTATPGHVSPTSDIEGPSVHALGLFEQDESASMEPGQGSTRVRASPLRTRDTRGASGMSRRRHQPAYATVSMQRLSGRTLRQLRQGSSSQPGLDSPGISTSSPPSSSPPPSSFSSSSSARPTEEMFTEQAVVDAIAASPAVAAIRRLLSGMHPSELAPLEVPLTGVRLQPIRSPLARTQNTLHTHGPPQQPTTSRHVAAVSDAVLDPVLEPASQPQPEPKSELEPAPEPASMPGTVSVRTSPSPAPQQLEELSSAAGDVLHQATDSDIAQPCAKASDNGSDNEWPLPLEHAANACDAERQDPAGPAHDIDASAYAAVSTQAGQVSTVAPRVSRHSTERSASVASPPQPTHAHPSALALIESPRTRRSTHVRPQSASAATPSPSTAAPRAAAKQEVLSSLTKKSKRRVQRRPRSAKARMKVGPSKVMGSASTQTLAQTQTQTEMHKRKMHAPRHLRGVHGARKQQRPMSAGGKLARGAVVRVPPSHHGTATARHDNQASATQHKPQRRRGRHKSSGTRPRSAFVRRHEYYLHKKKADRHGASEVVSKALLTPRPVCVVARVADNAGSPPPQTLQSGAPSSTQPPPPQGATNSRPPPGNRVPSTTRARVQDAAPRSLRGRQQLAAGIGAQYDRRRRLVAMSKKSWRRSVARRRAQRSAARAGVRVRVGVYA